MNIDRQLLAKKFKRALPTILSVAASIGVIGTAVLTAKATVEAEAESDKKEKIKKYIPAATVGTVTIACILGSNALSVRQQANLIAAYATISETYRAYRGKVIEHYGEQADRDILREISAEKAKDVSIGAVSFADTLYNDFEGADENERLFYDSWSQRYFTSTISRVLLAEYHFNRNFSLGMTPCLNDFYEFLGLDRTPEGEAVGWTNANGDYYWIDFFHVASQVDDMPCWIIDSEQPPEANYLDY